MSAAPRVPKKNASSSNSHNNTALPPSRATAITLVPNEQNVVFAGFENGTIHRYRRLNATELQATPGALAAAVEQYSDSPSVVLHGHTAPITGLFAPVSADEVTSCSLDGTVKFWTSTTALPEGGVSKRCTKTIQVGQPIRCMLPQGGGDSFFLGTANGNIIRVENHKVVEELTGGHLEAVTALAMAESGALLSASLDGTVVGWDLSTRLPVYAFKGHSGHIRAAAVSGSTLYTCGTDETFVAFPIPADFTAPVATDGNIGADEHSPNNNEYEGEEGQQPQNEEEEEEHAEGNNENHHHQQQNPNDISSIHQGGAGHQNTWPNVSWIIKPSAKIQLPWVPTSITMAGSNYAIVGTASPRSVVCIHLRTLNARITEYTEKIEASIRSAEKKLQKNASERKKIVNRNARKAIKEFKQQHGGGDETGAGAAEEEYQEEEYDEDGNYVAGGHNNNNNATAGGGGEEGEEFERQTHQEAHDKATQIDAKVAAQIARYAVLRQQYFTQSASQFMNSSVCDLVPQQREVSQKLCCQDAVLGVVAEGARIFVISGSDVVPMILRPKVRAV